MNQYKKIITLNWAYTFSNLTKQDWRYTKYKNEIGKLYQIVNLFGIHMMPTLLVFLATIPVIEIIDSNIFNQGRHYYKYKVNQKFKAETFGSGTTKENVESLTKTLSRICS